MNREKMNILLNHPWLIDLSLDLKRNLEKNDQQLNALDVYLNEVERGNLPAEFKSFSHFGNALLDLSYGELARQAYRLGLGKESQELIWNNIGFSLYKQDRFEESCHYFKAALKIQSNFSLAVNNLANALIKHALVLFGLDGQKNLDLAEKLLLESLSYKPDHDWAYLNLGNVWRKKDGINKAILWFKLALQTNPTYGTAHNNLAHAHLTIGNYADGFAHYEQRWSSSDFPSKNARFENIPYWDGSSDLNNQSILLHWEQGFGDMIQFCRYVYLLRDRYPKANIILETMEPLVPLFQQLASPEGFEVAKGRKRKTPPVNRVVSNDRGLTPGLNVQWVFPLMSLAKIFTVSEATIPRFDHYLYRPIAHPAWKEFLKSQKRKGSKLIGIQWAGRPSHGNDKHRSVSLEVFRPLIEMGNQYGFTFVSFQDGQAKEEVKKLGLNHLVVDVSQRVRSFADTAIMIKDMDHFVSVDTANLHLAGSLGVPAIGLIGRRSDFRWLLDRSDTPWYPSVQLIRQKHMLVWDGVCDEIMSLILPDKARAPVQSAARLAA
jgi:tetratricopeptide (TPR) repeat protein